MFFVGVLAIDQIAWSEPKRAKWILPSALALLPVIKVG
jgi:hypothetical protein